MNLKITVLEQQELVEAIDKVRAFIENLDTEKSCLSCLNWDRDKCKLAGRIPPDDVIMKGCPKWVIWDELPF